MSYALPKCFSWSERDPNAGDNKVAPNAQQSLAIGLLLTLESHA